MAQVQAPQFLPSREPRLNLKALGGVLVAVCTRDAIVQPLRIYRHPFCWKERQPFPAFFSSVLFHISVILFILRVPFAFFLRHKTPKSPTHQIVYEFHELVLPRNLPELKPPGPGGQPGKGHQAHKAAAKGSTAFHPKLTIISNPPNPDNNQQTIIQPSLPPAQKITMHLRLPNIVLGGVLPVPGPPQPVPPPPMKLSVPSTLKSLTIPIASVVSTKPPDLVIPASSTPNMPPIPVPAPPPPPTPPAPVPKPQPIQIANLGLEAAANGSQAKLLILSLNPGPMTNQVSVPAGNRYGAFSISPAGNQPGSAAGVPGGSPEAGEGGAGSGGDASSGAGAGNNGGGGGGKTGSLAASTSGVGSSGGAGGGILTNAAVENLVYPVLRPPPKNRLAMVVTAGPAGGGGLHVYGVLTGGKVYTIFLPMPQKNWILQYCALNRDANPSKPQSPRVAVQLSFGLIPPSVEKRFDFRRPELPLDLQNDMVVLHGVIDTDGSVQKLNVYQGVQDTADRAATAAFRRWKFRPALRDGKPIAIEILVGVPVR